MQTLFVRSIFGAQTGRGLVEISINGQKTLIAPDKAREIAGMLFQAAEAAIADEAMMKFITNIVGAPTAAAAALLVEARELRQKLVEEHKSEARNG